jgi:predicted RNase H-like HicB family nuclease
MARKLTYLIKLTYDKDYHGYVADVINLYGCMSQGKTKKEALENAKKAIKAYMEAIEKTERDKALTKEIINIPISFASI